MATDRRPLTQRFSFARALPASLAVVIFLGCGIPIRDHDPFSTPTSLTLNRIGSPSASVQIKRHGEEVPGDDSDCQDDFRATGLFSNVGVENPELADVFIAIESRRENNFTPFMWLSVLSGGAIPAPSMRTTHRLELSVSLPAFDMDVTRTYNDDPTHWVGWVFIPLVFLQDAATVDRACNVLAIDAYRAYADLHKEAWRRSLEADANEAYLKFARLYPQSEFTPIAETLLENRLFDEAVSNGSAALLAEFLRAYPTSGRTSEISYRLESVRFQDAIAADSIDALRNFLSQHPNSEYASRINQQIDVKTRQNRFLAAARGCDLTRVTEELTHTPSPSSMMRALALGASVQGAASDYTLNMTPTSVRNGRMSGGKFLGMSEQKNRNRGTCLKVAEKLLSSGARQSSVGISDYEAAEAREVTSSIQCAGQVQFTGAGGSGKGCYVDFDRKTGRTTLYSTGSKGILEAPTASTISLVEFAEREGLSEFVSLLRRFR